MSNREEEIRDRVQRVLALTNLERSPLGTWPDDAKYLLDLLDSKQALTDGKIAELLARAIRIARYQAPANPDLSDQISARTRCAAYNLRAGWDQGYAQALANIVRGLEGDLSFEALAEATFESDRDSQPGE